MNVKVFSGGQQINRLNCQYIKVDKEINRISTARIIFSYAAMDENKAEEIDLLSHGAKIEIKARHDDAEPSDQDTIFAGIVVKYALKKLERGLPSFVVDCKDAAYRLTLSGTNTTFREKKDHEMIEGIVQALNERSEVDKLKTDLQKTDITHKELPQHRYVSDWQFILNRAKHNGMYLFTNDGTLVMDRFHQAPNPAGPGLTLSSDDANIIEFEMEMDSRDQQPESYRDFMIWNLNTGEKKWEWEKLKADAPKIGEQAGVKTADLAAVGKQQGPILQLPEGDPNEIKARVSAKNITSILSTVRGRIKCKGTKLMVPGDMIRIDKVNAQFNGSAFVSGLRHTLHPGRWETDIQVGMPDEPLDRDHPASNLNDAYGLIPPLYGLHIGTVTKLSDTESNIPGETIQVFVPMIHGEEKGIWARMATEYAGEGRGTVFLPEIGDQVVLGFVQDDPRKAIILGVLRHASHTSPVEAQDSNPQKGIFTRSGMQILFDEDEESISIQSPGKRSVLVNDKNKEIQIRDGEGNELIMNADRGMKIKSHKNLSISCDGDMSIKAQNINIETNIGGNLQCEGTGVKMVSQSIMTLQGGVSVDLVGSVVNIPSPIMPPPKCIPG